jgi:hypothetical protein
VPPGLQPPVRWTTEAALRELFGARVADVRLERRSFLRQVRSIDHAIDLFRRLCGPPQRAFAANRAQETAIVEAMREAFGRCNRAMDGTAAILSEDAPVDDRASTAAARDRCRRRRRCRSARVDASDRPRRCRSRD